MGNGSCKISGDKCKIKSPLFGCLISHCESDCTKENVEQVSAVVIDNVVKVAEQKETVQQAISSVVVL
jgi:hypothetical protein